MIEWATDDDRELGDELPDEETGADVEGSIT